MNITLHRGTTFLLTSQEGDIRAGSDQGLYFEDSRFLSRFEMTVDGESPMALTARGTAAEQAVHVLTNPSLPGAPHKELGISRQRLLDDGVHEDFLIENYGDTEARFTLGFSFSADFVHIFDVKQAVESGSKHPAAHRAPVQQSVEHGRITWVRLRREHVSAELLIGFSREPEITEGQARFAVAIPPRGRWELWLHLRPRADASEPLPHDAHELPPKPRRDRAALMRQGELERSAPTVQTDHRAFASGYLQASRDMISLRLKGEGAGDGGYSLAAGIPWYMALFGRDSLIASYQTLLHDPTLARGTLRALAKLQGRTVNAESDEEPGKILHEQRHGPLLGDPKYIPVFPYYGTIDATPLFLVTLAEYSRITGDMSLATELRGNIQRALHWITAYGDRDRDGLLEYFRASKSGLSNQGWKDSWDSIRFHDGRVATGPIALVEVQGYVLRAYDGTARLFEQLGEFEVAGALRERASNLRQRLLDDFWISDRNFFAEALDGGKRRVDAVTSNPGHLLWCNAVPDDHARKCADVLLSDAMFTGYGIRTMASTEGGFNPISYHNGSVWPHDTALVAQGLSRYGLRDHAARVVHGMLDALGNYADHRLPELFAGFSAGEFGTPIEYPSANRPQAWASGAVILLARTILGLDVDAFAREIIVRPLSVPGISHLVIRGMPVGGVRMDIEFDARGGAPRVRVRGAPNDWVVREE